MNIEDQIRQSLDEAAAGNTIAWADAKKQMGFDPAKPGADVTVQIAVINHGGIEYRVDLAATRTPAPEVEYVDSIYSRIEGVYSGTFWIYDLKGEHEGPPIRVVVKNPRMEPDDVGWSAEYDGVYWFDDRSAFDNAELCDTYLDALRDQLRRDLCD